MGAALKVLMITESKDDERLVLDEMRRGGFDPDAKRVGAADEMRAALATGSWDVILCEDPRAGFDAAAALGVVAEEARDIPLILISDVTGMEPLVALIRKGVRDVIARSDFGRLVPTIQRQLHEREERHRRRQGEAEIRRQASFDPLTDLPNRRLFFDRLTQTMKRARRQGSLLSLLFVDLDGLKSVNDTLGHVAGDELLREVARRIESCIRESDTAARIGGDEFAIILGDATDAGTGEWVARKVLERVSRPYVLKGCEALVTASIGIAVYPRDGEDAETLLRNADGAMYEVKQHGRNGFRMFEPGMKTAGARTPVREDDLDDGGDGTVTENQLLSSASGADLGRGSGAWMLRVVRHMPRLPLWAAAIPLWVVILVAGWIVLSSLFSVVPPGGVPFLADGDETSIELDMAPASGPDDETKSR